MAVPSPTYDGGDVEAHDAEDCVGFASADEAPDQVEAAAFAASLAAVGVTPEELASCALVLRRLAEARAGQLDWRSRGLRSLRKALVPHLREAFGQLPQKDAINARERAKFERNCKRERRQRQLEADKRWKENAELRASRLARLEALEASGGPVQAALPLGFETEAVEAAARGGAELATRRIPDGPVWDSPEGLMEDGVAAEYARQQACYICKARFSERHHFYSHLCPPCATLNFTKRHHQIDLRGRVCLVTGARVKIGFAVALKFLRMGARVIATTRFPQDALRRFQAEEDANQWLERLHVRGIDFRFLGAVEELCTELLAREAWLDVLVNNACQTVRRPAAYYRRLLQGEGKAQAVAPVPGPSACALLADMAEAGPGALPCSAALSQLAVVEEDNMMGKDAAVALPDGALDAHGQQLDARASNSWLLRLGEVATAEAVEVFCINALTPFILNGRLRPLLERSPHRDRYIVNVSAMEGKFYRYKQPTHPHTNMAKAALNMMTRTSAEDLAKSSGIYMNSVDTGWINDENPLPTARRIAEDHGFQTPIDEVDAAARIVDPILTGVEVTRAGEAGGEAGAARPPGPFWGRFLKDYSQTEW